MKTRVFSLEKIKTRGISFEKKNKLKTRVFSLEKLKTRGISLEKMKKPNKKKFMRPRHVSVKRSYSREGNHQNEFDDS